MTGYNFDFSLNIDDNNNKNTIKILTRLISAGLIGAAMNFKATSDDDKLPIGPNCTSL